MLSGLREITAPRVNFKNGLWTMTIRIYLCLNTISLA